MSTQTAVVTGGSRGIGRAICLELAKSGRNIAVNFAGNTEKAEKTAADCRELGVKAEVYQADVSDGTQVQQMMKQIQDDFGSIDILVNNAGITKDNLLMRMKEEDFDAVVDTNLKGTFLCSKAVTRPMMKQRSGRIINISSIVASAGNPGQANYVASKAGILGLTKSMAKELANRNILVNAVSPGFISTEMTDELTEEQQEALLGQIPLGRLGEPEQIAGVVRFLTEEASAYMTGQTLHVDGGMYMG
ncbi:3-oxoacyl-[acyl-carrier-protein] reductase [Alkalicoccus urumqiensis]|uniref:3-oxoacyl-[acyl-carrier-protein] reductase n=1 Tax=Alkalicoccus urumqiensis TaxID=1548213 RepID=A0A2P6MG36_ALKUR|nr:3-oxoacyl-[acyl-carrier-protein] reductase [Alkalicoccus urumqiensis]PRO65262.1 beta-ketoacyl-ACP reductase [Alkalicoccus urumqiensis]